MAKNFYPDQYKKTGTYPINHNYLQRQFSDHEVIWEKIKAVVTEGDFTLGTAVDKFEQDFARLNGGKHGIGVGSGTDALFLSLKANGLDPGDEVITTPFTFFATIGAIVTAGAKPVFVDAGHDYNIDASKVENAISHKTKAIMPVHWSGNPCDMNILENVSDRLNIPIIADACHGILSRYHGKPIGAYGQTACFSMHPLKNLNVWGDGGIVVTNDDHIAERLSSLRNHGLMDRDHCQEWAYNSRLDTVQAVVAQHLLDNKIAHITQRRIANAEFLNECLGDINGVTLPATNKDKYAVYHLYMPLFENRDELQVALQRKGIDAKIHYPTPMHLQPAAKAWGYKPGDFPFSEHIANHCLSLPVHEFITEQDLVYMADCIREFYHQ